MTQVIIFNSVSRALPDKAPLSLVQLSNPRAAGVGWGIEVLVGILDMLRWGFLVSWRQKKFLSRARVGTYRAIINLARDPEPELASIAHLHRHDKRQHSTEALPGVSVVAVGSEHTLEVAAGDGDAAGAAAPGIVAPDDGKGITGDDSMSVVPGASAVQLSSVSASRR